MVITSSVGFMLSLPLPNGSFNRVPAFLRLLQQWNVYSISSLSWNINSKFAGEPAKDRGES
jgi:hypothetical protein